MNPWNSLKVVPPDTLCKVRDEKGNEAFAYPTYYPFTLGKPTGGKWSSPVIPCDPYWDGGWLVECLGLDIQIGDVVEWREVEKSNTF